MNKDIQPQLTLKKVTCSNGDQFVFLAHEKVEAHINLTISKQNHQAWTTRNTTAHSSNRKVLKFQQLEEQWKADFDLPINPSNA
jgi:ribosomal protein L31